MLQINITSLINEPVRELRFPGIKNVFLIAKLKFDELHYLRYAIFERQSMIILVTSFSLSNLIYKISELLARMSQNEFNEYLSIQKEFNE